MERRATRPWNSAAPIKLDHIKQASTANNNRKEMREFLESLPSNISMSLHSINPVKVQCSVLGTETRTAVLEEPAHNLMLFRIHDKQLHIWCFAEGDFPRMICEMAFGGVGSGSGEDEQSRPTTKLEERISHRVREIIVESIVKSIAESAGGEAKRVAAIGDEALEHLKENLQLMEVKLLLNAFSFGCELLLRIPRDEVEPLIKKVVDNQSPSISAYESLRACEFEMEVLLPPDEVPIGKLLSLMPGSELDLSLTADSPVVVRCGGEAVFEGEYSASDVGVAINLRELTSHTAGPIGENATPDREVLH